MVWKDFLYFSKGQRSGILIFISLILLLLVSTFFMPYFINDEADEKAESTLFLKEAEKFKASLIEKERNRSYPYDNYPEFHRSFPKKASGNSQYQLFTFDPNTADSATFVRLGLKSYIAKNIIKYRSKGGKFRKPDDFRKVYGISAEKTDELLPYIQIAEQKLTEETFPVTKSNNELAEKHGSEYTIKKNVIVELNSADTTTLMQIRGIGRRYAKSIVGYRRILGGYYSVEQIREVYGMRPETFEQIKPFLNTDPSLIAKIDVNKASIERLKSHPYLNFSKAKEIYELRREKGKLKKLDELQILHSLTPEDLQKIGHYLDFE